MCGGSACYEASYCRLMQGNKREIRGAQKLPVGIWKVCGTYFVLLPIFYFVQDPTKNYMYTLSMQFHTAIKNK